MAISFLRFHFDILRVEREDYRYSGSENEEEEHPVAGEPSSIINQVQGGDTLRRNFQQIQVRTSLLKNLYN